MISMKMGVDLIVCFLASNKVVCCYQQSISYIFFINIS